MRIGLVCYTYPPQQGAGGVGTYMFRLAGALGRHGHQVHVITGPSNSPPLPQPNVIVHRVRAQFDLNTTNRAIRWLYWHTVAPLMSWCNPTVWYLLRWDLASYKAILDVDSRYPLDLVEAPEHAANGWMAGRIHRWPIVLRMHCPWELFVRINRQPFNPMNRLLSALERRTIAAYADAITVPSLAMKREAEQSWTLRRPPLVIPNFMDVPEAPAPLPDEDGPQRIVCTGRIEPLKGQDTLARAFAMVARLHPRAELWLLGPDQWPGRMTFPQYLDKLVPDTSIRRRIHLTGLVPLATVAEHLRRARVAVVSSVGFESFSLSALEAMATARPTVVTDAGALPELVQHEQTGLVAPARSAYDLAQALDRMLGDRRFSLRCGLAAHDLARQRYDARRVLPQMLEAYEQAADYFHGPQAAAAPLPTPNAA